METSKGAEDMVETTVTKTVAELKGIPTQEILLEQLRKETLVVTFNKLDGDERIMTCTKSFDVIPEEHKPKTDKAPKEGNVTVWDINAKGWRSFKYDRITKVEDVQV
jgi:hypothetical protein|tara:strand:+ start:534 stop:854 length:321 start_codon:yes stop_codon:yes gene_type:complete